MSDIFGKLGAAAKRAANTVSTEVNVAAEEQKIREAYQALGKLYYKAVKKGEPTEGLDFSDQIRRIEAGLKRVAELKESKNVTDDYVDVE